MPAESQHDRHQNDLGHQKPQPIEQGLQDFGEYAQAFDFDDGEICFKTSVDCSGVDSGDDNLIMALVEPIVFINVIIMDMFLPAILKVIYGDVSPEQALAEIAEPELDEEDLRDS